MPVSSYLEERGVIEVWSMTTTGMLRELCLVLHRNRRRKTHKNSRIKPYTNGIGNKAASHFTRNY